MPVPEVYLWMCILLPITSTETSHNYHKTCTCQIFIALCKMPLNQGITRRFLI